MIIENELYYVDDSEMLLHEINIHGFHTMALYKNIQKREKIDLWEEINKLSQEIESIKAHFIKADELGE